MWVGFQPVPGTLSLPYILSLHCFCLPAPKVSVCLCVWGEGKLRETGMDVFALLLLF